jgi:carboxyl-terminal processing protease
MRTILKAGTFLAIVLCSFGFGFGWRELRSLSLPDADAVSRLLGREPVKPAEAPETVFRQAYSHILSAYYKPIVAKDLKYAAMEGLMASLGDPHTMFLEPELAGEFALETKANFVGVGASLLPDPLGAKVVDVFEDGPAARAGMRPKDLITAVNGKSTVGEPLGDVVDTIRGEPGTVVRLQVVHYGEPKPVTMVIRRAQVTTPTVKAKFIEDGQTGYLSIRSFSQPTAEQFDIALDKLDQKPLRGLVIDLRGNPGGLLDAAVDLVSRFAPNNTVVKMRFRSGKEEVVRSYPGVRRQFSYPVVILVNEDSASAAEIMAGALRDYKMATIMGDHLPGKTSHTYGKSAVQNVFELKDQSSAKITIAKYFLPSGVDIGRKVDEDGQYLSGGLIPDISVEVDPDKLEEMEAGDPAKDPLLKRAIEFIQQKQG